MGDQVYTKEQAIDWIHHLKTFGIKPGLSRMEWMLERLNHPERNVKFIHIAGTNGKGSTASFLHQVLKKSGYRVGLFTSPYLIDFTNRIQVNGEDISGEHLVGLVNKLIPLAEELAETELGAPTEFEIVTALALLYFGTVAYPDVVVWEVGLGGRLDSTNVVFPIVSVITNIGYDHMEYLGHDIKDIAFEKAGIIKSGVPVVSGVDIEEAVEVIKEIAKGKRAKVYQLDEQFSTNAHSINENGSSFDFKGPYLTMPDIEIKMLGPHQIRNAALALMTLELLRQFYAFQMDEDAIYAGMKSTFWPGRFEKLGEKPTIIIDGAHNPQGAKTLRETVNLFSFNRLILVTGILKDKAVHDFYQELMPIADKIIVTEADYGRAASTEEVIAVMSEIDANKEVVAIKEYKSAVDHAFSVAEENDLVVLTGSLYLISDIRRYIMININSLSRN